MFIRIFKLFDCHYRTAGISFHLAPSQSSLSNAADKKEAALKEAASLFECLKKYC